MKIGVIADTHISPVLDGRYLFEKDTTNDPGSLFELIEPHFRDVEAIIHAGDITHFSVIEVLKTFGEVYAIAGNMDNAEVHRELGDKKIIELNNYRIGIIHGWGAKEGLSTKVREKFGPEQLDCIVFGHTHNPYNKIEHGILMFNPGSPTDRRFADTRNIGILHLQNSIWGELIYLD